MTGSALRSYVERREQYGIDVATTVQLLRRYSFLERSCIRALAGWFLSVPAYERKIALGYQLWSHIERVDAMRRRLHELRGGHRDANIEPALQLLGEELVNAPDEASFLAGVGWLLEQLSTGYCEHLALADSAANAMEQRLLRGFLGELANDRERLSAISQAPTASSATAAPWVSYLAGLLAAAAGVSGLEPRQAVALSSPGHSRFSRPTRNIFDERLTTGELFTQDQKQAMPFEERRVAEFRVFFNEFYAAALLASVIYDAWNSTVPWEFFVDIGHQFWDEVRHAEFGLLRLRELGIEPSVINQTLFEQAQGMPFLHRFCYLTLGLEVFFMPRKKPRYKQYEAAGDGRSQLFADVDWSDEQNHVRYGQRWVEFLLQDDARSVEDLQAEIADYLSAYKAQLPEGQLAPF
jgi:hypothetical protein